MNFAQPGWLALLILLPILGTGALLVSRLRRQQWTVFVAPRLRDALIKQGSSLPRWFAFFFLLAACAMSILALARPVGDAGTKIEKSKGRNVMIALDISRSMRVNDVKPDRLSQAKVVIYELLEAMPNERIGFIGFAGTPYVYAPLTIDHGAVRETVEQVDETWAPRGGSDLPAAVRMATETLKKTGQKNNALVILSDGEEIHDDDHRGELESMVREAEQAGVYIIAMGVGTEDGGFVPNSDFPNGQMIDRTGRTVISRLQADSLRKLAEGTKGRFALVGSGMDLPEMVKSVVKGLDAFEVQGRERKISIEFYQWLVFPVILFLMTSIVAGTRWKSVQAAVFVAGVFLTAPAVCASEATDAKDALLAKRYEEARDSYHKLADSARFSEAQARYRLGEATASYRSEDFRSARTAFSQSLLSQDAKVQASGHIGMGNTLFQLGWKGLSGESYSNDPASMPDLDRFDTIVKEALAKLSQSESSGEGETGGFVQFKSLVTNWVDAVRHYESAQALTPSETAASKNRELTVTYLKRLEELLNQEQEETEQSMPQPQSGEGPPKEGDGDSEEQPGKGKPSDGKGDQKGPKNPGGKGEENQDSNKGEGDDSKKKGDGNKGNEKSDKKGDKSGKNPNESPEERAKRVLDENKDLEKGPLTRGRFELRDPEKDW
jgi:Ca-activated chloride channel family protein